MGIKKAQARPILSAGLGTAPIHLWLETALWCAVPMMYRFAHKSLVRGTNSAERLSNKKICIPFEMRVTRTVQTECRELALCRGAARSRTNFVQSYELSMKIGHGGCFF